MSGPAFATIPRISLIAVSVANALRNGTGTIANVCVAGSQGSKIERVKIKALDATTAGTIRLFLFDTANWNLLSEHPVTAVTPSATLPAFEDDVDFSGQDQLLVLPAGWILGASTEKAEPFNIIAIGADYPVS